jgi:hypothetical protein
VAEKLSRLHKNGQLIVERTHNYAERDLVQSTCTTLTDQLDQLQGLVQRKKVAVRSRSKMFKFVFKMHTHIWDKFHDLGFLIRQKNGETTGVLTQFSAIAIAYRIQIHVHRKTKLAFTYQSCCTSRVPSVKHNCIFYNTVTSCKHNHHFQITIICSKPQLHVMRHICLLYIRTYLSFFVFRSATPSTRGTSSWSCTRP